MLCNTYSKNRILKHIYTLTTYFVIFVLIVTPYCKTKSKATHTAESKVRLLILMYHGFTNDNNVSDYVLGISDFEKDIVYLKENGFNFVNTKDIINYVYHNDVLPKNPVMITIDYGYLNNRLNL